MGSILSKSFLTDRLLRDSPQRANNIDPPAAVPPTLPITSHGRLKEIKLKVVPSQTCVWIGLISLPKCIELHYAIDNAENPEKSYISQAFFSVFVPFTPPMALMPFPTRPGNSSSSKDIVARQMMPIQIAAFLSSFGPSALSATASAFFPNNNPIAQRHAMQMFYNPQLTYSGLEYSKYVENKIIPNFNFLSFCAIQHSSFPIHAISNLGLLYMYSSVWWE
jgi:hypothetical protein